MRKRFSDSEATLPKITLILSSIQDMESRHDEKKDDDWILQ